MRRIAGIATATALALALCSGVVRAASFLPVRAASVDLSAQVMMQLFGETSDARASFAAASGDRGEESFMRGLALRIDSAYAAVAFAPDPFAQSYEQAPVALAAMQRRLLQNMPRFVPSSLTLHAQARPTAEVAVPERDSAYAERVPQARSLAVISSNAGPVSFSPAHDAESIAGNLRVGPVQFRGGIGGSSSQAPQVQLNENDANAAADFAIRAGNRDVNLNLSSTFQQVTRNDANAFSAPVLNSSWQLPGSDAPFAIPSYANVNRVYVGANVAVPVRSNLTLNLNYGAQRFYGGYGLPGATNLDTTGNTYGGGLTFAIPHSSGLLSISATQYHYQDNVLQSNATTQTNANVNFTVKF